MSSVRIKPGAKNKPAHVVKTGRTSIPIYQLKTRNSFQFRYYVAGVAKVLTRSTLEAAIEAAEEKANGIENGRIQAGDLSAADVQSFYHAKEELAKLGPTPPPLHVALEDYVAARRRLPAGSSIEDAVDALLRQKPVDARAATVAEVLGKYLLAVGDQAKNPRYLRGLRCDLARFVAWLPAGRKISEATTEEIQTYLRALTAGTMADTWRDREPKAGSTWKAIGPRRRDNIRDAVVGLFQHAKEHGYLPEDRLTAAEKVKRLNAVHEVKFYTPEQLVKFFTIVREEWIPWLALGAFAGMRSSEIVGDPEDPARPRLRWSDFRWEKGYIVVPALVAQKIKRSRRVPLRANLMAWLLPWRNATGYLYPEGADQSRETERIERVLKLPWDNNALRHSYGTHRNAELGNAGQLAEEMGTSVPMIRKNYDAVPADIEPKDYFGISPGAGAKIIDLATAAERAKKC